MDIFISPTKIDLKKLSNRYNPFKSVNWVGIDTPIKREEIEQFIKKDKLQSPDVPIKFSGIWDVSNRETHIKRIAWLVKNYDENYPIEIDFGIPNLGVRFQISDGIHRLHASFYLREKYILANCSGAISEIGNYTY